MQLATAPTAGPCLLAGCLVVLVLALPGAHADEPPDPVDAAELEAGDVVAQGTPSPLGCRFEDPTRIRLDPQEVAGTDGARLDLATDDGCRMVVRYAGPLHPPLRLLPAEGHSRSDEPNGSDSGGAGSTSGVSTMASSKIVHTDTVHYGNGGQDDELTQKRQWIDFSWDGTDAWIDDHAGDCWWVTGWVNDACVLDTLSSPGDPASRHSHGDFHFEDPFIDTYYHTLEALTYGFADGDHFCDYSWSGDIVNGVYMDCYL